MDRVRDLASKKAAVIFTKSSCYMCHSITQLFYELGASPAVHELDKDAYGREMEWALRSMGCNPSVPAVFIGGKFVGSSKDVISLHVDGSLKQMLMAAKAIWGEAEGDARGQERGGDIDIVGELVAIKSVIRTLLANVDGDSNIIILGRHYL
ncbi:Glutaredoxin-C11 protein [Vigna angularis]|uniref:Glutaredoxin-C11 protein n=1 Tax=Phaseolus angularis TaxID=3914 RepID=A0A8T0KV71_PHAAN|nr:Glutaredoxin-C11 protein [Vigna angularis]